MDCIIVVSGKALPSRPGCVVVSKCALQSRMYYSLDFWHAKVDLSKGGQRSLRELWWKAVTGEHDVDASAFTSGCYFSCSILCASTADFESNMVAILCDDLNYDPMHFDRVHRMSPAEFDAWMKTPAKP